MDKVQVSGWETAWVSWAAVNQVLNWWVGEVGCREGRERRPKVNWSARVFWEEPAGATL